MDALKTSQSDVKHLETSPLSFNRILVGTDFSEPAQRALQVALDIADLFGAEISIANSVSFLLPSMASGGVAAEAVDVVMQSAADKIDDEVKKHRGGDVRYKKVTSFAGAVDLLVKTVQDEKIDLLVLGSHAASGAGRIVLGSVAETVLRYVTCPVLITGPLCHKNTHPFRSILFATDLTATGLRPAQYATALAEQFQSRLTMLHVMEEKRSVAGGERDEMERACRKQLEILLPENADLWCLPKTELAYGDPAEEILAAANSCDATLIITGTGEHRALADHSPWSTLGRVLHEAKCPVLAVAGHLAAQ